MLVVNFLCNPSYPEENENDAFISGPLLRVSPDQFAIQL